ncbi:tellurium resistance protein TerZ [Nakamurella sp. UYEF19]|uniref:TerD family protein n=1 Tax=Nakamurella sp. UYEF19 TaxID=1756392 RepID=UPI003395797E
MAINLSKGQSVSLTKSDGGSLSKVHMTLSWAAASKKGFFGGSKTKAIDLDASCLIFGSGKHLLDQVWFQQLGSRDGSIVHTGDDRTGGAGETITVDLGRLPAEVTGLVFVVNSYSGESFSQIENATAVLIDSITNQPLANYTLAGSGPHTALVMAKVGRAGSGWAMTAIGAPAAGTTFHDLMPAVDAYL